MAALVVAPLLAASSYAGELPPDPGRLPDTPNTPGADNPVPPGSINVHERKSALASLVAISADGNGGDATCTGTPCIAVSRTGDARGAIAIAPEGTAHRSHQYAIDAGRRNTCALQTDDPPPGTTTVDTDHNVECWGEQSVVEDADRGGGNMVAVSAGWEHTCALNRQVVKCDGDNHYGQAEDYRKGGAGYTPGPWRDVHPVAISAGGYHTCVLQYDRDVLCYGDDTWGQAVDLRDPWDPDAVAVSAGGYHTCIIPAPEEPWWPGVICEGRNGDGQAEDYPGDALSASAGGYHTCVLRDDRTVHCYGSNDHGQAADYGRGDAVALSAGLDHTCALRTDGSVHCWGDNRSGQAADYNGSDAVALSAGGQHTCILRTDGTVHCYGADGYDQSDDAQGIRPVGLAVSNHGVERRRDQANRTITNDLRERRDRACQDDANTLDCFVWEQIWAAWNCGWLLTEAPEEIRELVEQIPDEVRDAAQHAKCQATDTAQEGGP